MENFEKFLTMIARETPPFTNIRIQETIRLEIARDRIVIIFTRNFGSIEFILAIDGRIRKIWWV